MFLVTGEGVADDLSVGGAGDVHVRLPEPDCRGANISAVGRPPERTARRDRVWGRSSLGAGGPGLQTALSSQAAALRPVRLYHSRLLLSRHQTVPLLHTGTISDKYSYQDRRSEYSCFTFKSCFSTQKRFQGYVCFCIILSYTNK